MAKGDMALVSTFGWTRIWGLGQVALSVGATQGPA